MKLRLPSAMSNEAEWLQVWNSDLSEFTPSELVGEMYRAARIVARYPRGVVWRGTIPIPARVWGDERVNLCRALLRPPEPPKGTVRGWGR